MSEFLKALERAARESRARREEMPPLPPPPPTGRAEPCGPAGDATFLDRYQDLKANLLTRYPDGFTKSIVFVGAAQGDGASTTAVNFATILARDGQLAVLLVDANLRTPSLHHVFDLHAVHGLPDFVTDNRRGGPLRVEPPNLYVIPRGESHCEPVTLFESNGFDTFLKKTRDAYDYVILDGPPVQRFPECRILSRKVDGVILVIESGRTRRQVALNAKRQIEEAGGKILGVVLNGRRYYIPKFIYRRL